MANSDMKAKLVIEANATGGAEIEAIAQHLQDLADEGGQAAPKLDALAQSLREAANQQQLIDGFARLKRETQDLAQATDAATAQVDKLAREQAQAAQAAQDAAQAQARAAQALDAAKQHQQQLRDAVAQARAELKNSRQELQQAGDSQEVYAERVRDAAAQLKVLQGEQQQAADQVRLLAAAYKEGEAATRNAARAQADVGTQYDRAVVGAAQLSSAMGASNRALQGTREAMQAAGIDTKGLTDQQAALKLRLQEGVKQAQLYAEAVQEMRSEAHALAPALEATFKQLGMRGVQQITAEIEQLQTAMRSLKGQKMLPEDAARASAELQRRIEALRAEMGITQGAARSAGAAVQDLGHKADGAGSQLSDAAHKAAAWAAAMVGLGELKSLATEVVNTGSSFEQLERRLVSILGSTDKAKTAFAMIRELAQQTPFDVQGLTEAYAKLSAFGLQPTRAQMLAMADASAALGGGTEMLEGVTLALGQAWVKSKLQGEEILQLAERGVPAWDLLASATGKNVQELQKMAEAGLLGRDAILQLIDAMGKKSAGASAELMNTYAGAVQRAQDALQEFYNMIAQSGVLEYLTQQLQGLLIKFDQLKASGELQQWAQSIAGGFRDVAEGAQNLFALLQLLEPAIKLAVAAMVASKVASWAEALRGSGAAAREAATANGKLAEAADKASGAMGGFMRLAAGMAYGALALEILKIVSAMGELYRERQKQAAIATDLEQKEAQVAQRLREISEATGVVVGSMQELNAAQSAGLLVYDQATGKWLSAAQAQQQLATATKQTVAEMAAVDASKLVAEFEKVATSADKTKEAIAQLAKGLQVGDVQGVTAFVTALDELAAKGKLSAKEVGSSWEEALGKLNAGQIGALRANLEEAARQGVISAQQWAAANEQILAASFDKLGVNAAQALGKISTGAQEAINNVALVAESAVAAGVGVQEAARAIEMAFVASIPKADSLQAVDAMGQQLRAMGASGQVGADGVARMQAALDKQRATIEDQMPGIQSLGEALRQLGVKPQAELDELARKSKEAFDVVKASGTATPREINAAWKAMAEAAIAANDGVADASIKAQAQAHGFVVKTDAAGKSTLESMKGAKDATDEAGEAAKAAGEDYEKLGHLAEEAGAKVDVAKEHFLDATRAQSQYAQEAYDQWMKLVGSSTDYAYSTAAGFAKLQQGMKDMVDGLEELDRQQQELNNNSAQGVADLELRLLELQGTEEEVAAARAARESAEVEKKRALLELDVQRARLRGDKEEVARLTEELGLLDKQLALLQKIHAEEKKQRTEREREEKNREREKAGGGSGGSAAGGGSGGGGSRPGAAPERGPATVPTQPPAQAPGLGGQQPQRPVASITINANGINDPVKLARLLEPELKRLAVLAR